MLLLLHVCMYVSVCPSVRDRFGVRQGRDLGHIKVVTQARPAGRGGERGGRGWAEGRLYMYTCTYTCTQVGTHTYVVADGWTDGSLATQLEVRPHTAGMLHDPKGSRCPAWVCHLAHHATHASTLPEQLTLVDAHIRTCMFPTGGNNGQACVRAPRLLCSALQKGTPKRAGDLGLARGGVSWSE